MTTRLRPDNPECLCEACECFPIQIPRYAPGKGDFDTPSRIAKMEAIHVCGECDCETCHTDGNTSRAFCYHSPSLGELAHPEDDGAVAGTISDAFLCWNPSNMLENARTIYNQIKLWEKEDAEEAS